MNDDLKLILTVLTEYDNLSYIVLEIKHGMNDDFWRENFGYFSEEDVFTKYKELMPSHVQSFVKKILDVNEAFEIIKD